MNLGNADIIIQFKQLLDSGIITAEEFEKKKNELLGNTDAVTYIDAKNKISTVNTESEFRALEATFRKISHYKESEALAEECLNKANAIHNENIYQEAVSEVDRCETSEKCKMIIENLIGLGDYKDSASLIEKYNNNYTVLKEAEAEAAKKTKKAKRKKVISVVTAIILVASLCISYFLYFKPLLANSAAKTAMNNGEYYVAFLKLAKSNNSMSDELLKDCIKELTVKMSAGQWSGKSRTYYDTVSTYYGSRSASCTDTFTIKVSGDKIKLDYEKYSSHSSGSNTLTSTVDLALDPSYFETICKSSTESQLIFDYSDVEIRSSDSSVASGFFLDKIVFDMNKDGTIAAITVEEENDTINLKKQGQSSVYQSK